MAAELRVIPGGRDTAGKVPPCNVELEEDFLGMLLFADSRAEVAKARGLGLRTECFYSDATARIWQGICALADAPDGDVGLVAVSEWLRARGWLQKVGGTSYLAKLADCSCVGTWRLRGHAARILALWRLRQLQAAAHRVAAEIYFDVGDVDAYLKSAVAGLTSAAEVTAASEIPSFRTTLRQSWEALTSTTGQIGGYPTGLRTYDARVGGLHPREVLLVSGKEKAGKSMVVGQWCAEVARQVVQVQDAEGRAVSRRRGALILSLDSAKTGDWAERVASAEACVDLEAFRVGTATEEDRRALSEAFEVVSALPVRVDSEHIATIGQMGARIRAVRDEMAGEGVDLCVVAIDYIQLAGGAAYGQTDEQRIGNAMRAIVGLAGVPDFAAIAWVVISQTNNDGELSHCKSLAKMADGWVHLTVDDEKGSEQGWMHRSRGWVTAPVYPGRIEVNRSRRGAQGKRARPIALWCCYRFTFFFCDENDV